MGFGLPILRRLSKERFSLNTRGVWHAPTSDDNMRVLNSWMLTVLSLLLLGLRSSAQEPQSTVTLYQVLPSQLASLLTDTSTPTATPTLTQESFSFTITPIGTADSGSETTYSLREVVPLPVPNATEHITFDYIIVESASGHIITGSQVIDPSATGTAASATNNVHIASDNCTFNLEDGTGVCIEEFSGETGTATFTGVLLPFITIGVDSSGAMGIGVASRMWGGALLFTAAASWFLL
ncbi:hypothetical protein VKT23_010194 [Stygiomarasmius scandens]|uniref:Uncharacterized protein n=1 Tax=Marasmiellus scandens TaxID=2682957 RepID=A0ABR1JD57_9AGAR